ncbi:hypothetical protein RHGRI_000720 [Rhododendron griersonianum]|uniref:Uncharacterized protein n=1 Tax=Rhododendron griersonianum TaxID=479676 RepID=A0AAV6LK57_9ERIC|nr:hypothetical protein RHGRI_000720 [Rhododendron griersonianum]
MGNLGTDAYDSHFPGLASPVLVSGVANGVRVSSGSVERRVDLIEVLEKATVSSFDHLLPSDVDGPAARQIKQLHTEILMLRRELLGKGVHSSPNSAVEVAQAAARTGKPPPPSSWKDVVSADSSGAMSDNPMISRPKQQVWVVKPSISSVGAPSVVSAKDLPDSIEVPCMGVFSAKDGVCPTLLSSAKDKVVSADPCVSVVVGAESVAGSSSGTKDGANMFSVLQQMEDGVSQKGADSGDDLESLPTEEEFVAGLTHDVIVTSPVPKKRGRGRSKGVKKPSIHNFSLGPVARIFLGWDPSAFTCSVLLSSDQLIVAECSSVDGNTVFILSIVYGHNNPMDRRKLWADMRSIAGSIGTKPWVQMGDFNSVRAASERLVGFDVASSSEFSTKLLQIHEDD